jgi:glycosyltransferase involved in cell wall biosynthesis
MVLDGGSTDGSLDIIRRYDADLAFWASEPDGGQAAAINQGFARATGEILCWLNSDDMLLPGALRHVAGVLDPGRPELVFGNCLHFTDGDATTAGSDVRRWHRLANLDLIDYIVQPATFWTRDAWEATGRLDERMVYAFDWDWFIRARRAGVSMAPDDKYLAVYRIHDDRKTSVGGSPRLDELAWIYATYSGPRFERLYKECLARKRRLQFWITWIHRFRLQAARDRLLVTACPRLFRGFTRDEVRDVVNVACS